MKPDVDAKIWIVVSGKRPLESGGASEERSGCFGHPLNLRERALGDISSPIHILALNPNVEQGEIKKDGPHKLFFCPPKFRSTAEPP